MPNIYTLAETVQRLETVSVSAQQLFQSILLETLYREKRGIIGLHKSKMDEIQSLVDAGLLILVDDPEQQLRGVKEYASYSKHPHLIFERLFAAGYTDRKKSWDHISFCLEHPELIDVVAFDGICVSIAPEFSKYRNQVYSYLLWKFEEDSYVDGETLEDIYYPKGAEFRGKMSISNNESVDGWYYPDNEISALLERYGHLRCPIWKED